jgi:hypothetical protein
MGMVKAFRCSHSGLYYPADYVKEWGRKYGIGLGEKPVSECHDTQYLNPAVRGNDGKEMHPTGVTGAQVDFCHVDETEYNANRAIIDLDDPNFLQRAEILKSKQSINRKSKTYDAAKAAKAGIL